MDSATATAGAKAGLRAAALARRATLTPEARQEAAEAIAAAISALPVPPGALVSGFFPIRDEIDPMPAMRRLAARGHRLALPVVLADRVTMIFRAWQPGEPLRVTGFGLSVPLAEAPEVQPDVVLTPLAAFDRRGYRIGYGKGHYDRALARLRAARPVLEVGLGFACQEIARVPEEPHDIAMRWIVTEAGTIDCAGGNS